VKDIGIKKIVRPDGKRTITVRGILRLNRVLFDVSATNEKGEFKYITSDLEIAQAIELRDALIALDLGVARLRLGNIRDKLEALPDDALVEDIDFGKLDCG
jgi:hypothetical protein